MSTSKAAPVVVPGQNSMLPLWMRQSLEHLSMKTNLEEYGTSPPENESLFLHEGKMPNYSMAHLDKKPESITSVGNNCSTLVVRARELGPRFPRPLHTFEHESMMGDQVCPSSAPHSECNTPSVTPQHSPTLMRRILSADISAASNSLRRAGTDLKGSATDCARKARLVPVMRVTNFDLNAVSPTSW